MNHVICSFDSINGVYLVSNNKMYKMGYCITRITDNKKLLIAANLKKKEAIKLAKSFSQN